MEDERVINCFLGFWIHFCNVLCYEFDFMGRRFFSCRSIYHNLRAVLSDVRITLNLIALNTLQEIASKMRGKVGCVLYHVESYYVHVGRYHYSTLLPWCILRIQKACY